MIIFSFGYRCNFIMPLTSRIYNSRNVILVAFRMVEYKASQRDMT